MFGKIAEGTTRGKGRFLKSVINGFASSKGKIKKVQTIGFASNNIENIKYQNDSHRSLGFKPT